MKYLFKIYERNLPNRQRTKSNLIHLESIGKLRMAIFPWLLAAFLAGVIYSFFLTSKPVFTSAVAQTVPQSISSADNFVDSIGVSTHYNHNTGNNSDFYGLVKPRLQEIGVRHVRTDAMTGANARPAFIQKARELGSIGIKSLLIMDHRLQAGSDNMSPAEAVRIIKEINPEYCLVEGPNEPDNINYNWLFSYNGYTMPGSKQGLIDYTRDLWRAVKEDSQTRDVPVVLTSLGADTHLGNLSSYIDYGNIHPYPDGSQPGWQYEWYLTGARGESSSKPLMATETGYHTALERTDGYWAKPVPEDIQAKYLARTLFYNWNRGIKRTYLYQLVEDFDQPGQRTAEQHFALIRADRTPKPAFTAIKNIISILKDENANFTPQTLNYNLSGDLSGIETTLLQKSNGKFYLIIYNNAFSYEIWKDEYNWCHGLDCYVNVPNRNLTLNLAASILEAKIYQPLSSTAGTNVAVTNNQISLSVPDHPLIVELTPSSNNSTNLVANPSFEADPAGTQTPAGWLTWSGNATENADYTENHGGAHTGSYHGTHRKADGNYEVYTYQTFTGLENGTYNLRAYVKSSGGQEATQMEAKRNINGSGEVVVSIPSNNQWTPIELTITVTNGTCTIGFYSAGAAGQYIYFDSVEFYRI